MAPSSTYSHLSFTYSPLPADPERAMIRILELLPESVPAPIKCNLRLETLLPMSDYEALSYCWGPTPPHPTSSEWRAILCNGAYLNVTTNLFYALTRLRHPNNIRRLWVDAVCINQVDAAEKSHQVQLMGRIYSSARSVAVWLGEHADDSPVLESFLPSLVEAQRKMTQENDTRSLLELPSGSYGLPPLFSKRGLTLYYALCCVLYRPWFHRMWIVQEISLAKHAVVYCGAWGMDWEVFANAVLFVQDIGLMLFPGAYKPQFLQALQWSRDAVAKATRQDLTGLLLRHRTAEATEKRDKIFALCGLATDGHVVTVDYSDRKSWMDVYREVTVAILEHSQRLDILSAAHLHDFQGLPSWVPNWTVAKEANLPLLLPVSSLDDPTLAYRATGDSRCCPTFNKDRTVLRVSGMIVDKIEECGPTVPLHEDYQLKTLPNGFKMAIEAITEESVLYLWEKVTRARTKSTYPTGKPMLEAYWRSLCTMPPDGDTDTVTQLFIAHDNYVKPNRWLLWFLLDILRLDHLGLTFQVLSLLFGTFIIISRLFGPRLLVNSGGLSFKAMMLGSVGRKMFRTKKGYIGLGTPFVRSGDTVALFPGSRVPLIIRNAEELWVLLGEAYIYGMMEGEVFDQGLCEIVEIC